MSLSYPVVVVREKGEYWAFVPDLPGVFGRGRSQGGVKKDIAEALKLYVEDCRINGEQPYLSSVKVVAFSEVAIQA